MSKNKGQHGKGESTIPVGDQFLMGAEKVLETLKPHKTKIIVFALLALGGLVAFTVFEWYTERKERMATDTLNEALVASQAIVVAEGEDPPEAKTDGLEPPLYFDSDEARADAVLAGIQAVGSDYGSLGLSDFAALTEGKAHYDKGQFDQAAQAFKRAVAAKLPEPYLLSARENVGYALEAKAEAEEDAAARQSGLEAALAAFQAMQPDPDGDRRDVAQYHSARLQAELGKVEEAIAAYRAILTDHPDTELKADIESRLLALGAKKE